MGTKIEWTDDTWNPVTGCTKVSPGCDHCYAETLAERFRGTPGHYYEHGFDVQLRPDKLDQPLRWRKPRRIFVNSMSDLFHDAVPMDYIERVFAVMAASPQHTFQVLTKRHGRMRSMLNQGSFWANVYDTWRTEYGGERNGEWAKPLPNVWLGVSVENQLWADIRIPALLMTPAAVHFLSCEPLLGPVDLTRVAWTGGGGTHLDVVHGWHGVPDVWRAPGKTIDWVIVGGESGRGARPMHPDWARSLRDQCAAGVPFLFKQNGEFVANIPTIHDATRPGRTAPDWDRVPGVWIDRVGRTVHRETDVPDTGTWTALYRVGKRAAGRELDGRTWDEYPTVAA